MQNGHKEVAYIFAAFARKSSQQTNQTYTAGLKAHIRIPLEMLVNEPERYNRRD